MRRFNECGSLECHVQDLDRDSLNLVGAERDASIDGHLKGSLHMPSMKISGYDHLMRLLHCLSMRFRPRSSCRCHLKILLGPPMIAVRKRVI